MKVTTRVLGIAACLMLAGVAGAEAQGKAKTPAAKEQVWQVEFATAQDVYTGTMTLTVVKGVVSGKMLLDSPTKIEGTVEGKQAGGTISLDFAYTIAEQNCTGRVKADARIASGSDAASGPFTATGCSEEPVEGTLTMKKGPAADK